MTTLRGNAGGYGIGPSAYGGGLNDNPSESNALDAIRQQTSKIEDLLDSVAEPVKPYGTSFQPNDWICHVQASQRIADSFPLDICPQSADF